MVQTVSLADMKKARKANQRVEFYKLSPTTSNIRLLGPGMKIRHNVYKVGGNWKNSLDGDFLLRTEDIAKAALEAGKITQQDLDLYAAVGDPFTSLAERHKLLGLEVPRGIWPSTRYIWPIVDRDNAEDVVMRFESSKTFFEAISALLKGDYPDLFNVETGFDIKVVGNGEPGTKRRYQAPVAARAASPVGFDVTIPDFVPSIAASALPFVERVQDLFDAHGDACMAAGFAPKSFGLTAKQVAS